METRKVKTMAEMASYYGVSEEEFRKMVESSKLLKKSYSYQLFDGVLLYPVHQNLIFEKFGNPFQPSLEPQPEPKPKPIILEPIRPVSTGIRINLNFSETEVQDLLKELVGVFAKNYNQPINLPFTNQEKS